MNATQYKVTNLYTSREKIENDNANMGA